jgi:hypothetical protein
LSATCPIHASIGGRQPAFIHRHERPPHTNPMRKAHKPEGVSEEKHARRRILADTSRFVLPEFIRALGN